MQLKELWKAELGRRISWLSPVYQDGLIYTIENQKGRLHVIDAKTGAGPGDDHEPGHGGSDRGREG